MPNSIFALDGSSETTLPVLILGLEGPRLSQNIVHDLVAGGIGVTLRAPRPRAGRLTLLYLTEPEARACVTLHARPTRFALTTTEYAEADMTYITSGVIDPQLDAPTKRWRVVVEYQEVIA